jgi:hypothetical protein
MKKKIEKFNAKSKHYTLIVEIVSHLARARPLLEEKDENPFNSEENAVHAVSFPLSNLPENLLVQAFERQYTISVPKASSFSPKIEDEGPRACTVNAKGAIIPAGFAGERNYEGDQSP